MAQLGIVYVLHFDRPYAHARHYVGFTRNLDQRIARHRAGLSSPLMRAVRKARIGFKVARIWHGVTRRFERRVHHMQTKLLCPLCTHRVGRRARPRPSDFEDLEYARQEHPSRADVLSG
jgi:hypothetical protein